MATVDTPKSIITNGDHQQDDYTRKTLEFIEDVMNNVGEVQKRVLSEILTRNADVEYLKTHGLGHGGDASDNGNADQLELFKKKIPVITYEELSPYIKRIANDGDTSPILCSQPISEFLASSGTSGGESKLFPSTEEDRERRANFQSLVPDIVSQHIPGFHKKRGMCFLFVYPETHTPSGLPARSALTSYYKTRHFLARPLDPYTSPNEAVLCPDPFQSLYAQLLCGLCLRKEVSWVGATFAHGLIHALNFLANNWESLCRDIRSGSLDPRVADPGVRGAVTRAALTRPDPALAGLVESECSKASWGGIIRRLWPNAECINCIISGSMSQYISSLDYYSGGLPIVSPYYASSECACGLNLNPLCKPNDVAYAFLPTMAYFEFLPLNKKNHGGTEDNTDPQGDELVDLVDVKLGQDYEIVVTTFAGLYRYRIGDVFRVEGFRSKAPQFKFVCRAKVVLSIGDDKTEEADLENAVSRAAGRLAPFDAFLLEYTSYADVSTTPGHYVLFWEIARKSDINRSIDVVEAIPRSAIEECCLAVEEALDVIYRECRALGGSIGPLEIRVVENGSFHKLREYATTKGGASLGQYKTPRSVKSGPMVELLNSRVVSKFFSPSCPTWSPAH